MNPLPESQLPVEASPSQARAYLLAHDARVQRIDRISSTESLNLLWRRALARRGMSCLLGGPREHDELVNAIVDMEYPDAQRARDIYYAWVQSGKQPALGQE